MGGAPSQAPVGGAWLQHLSGLLPAHSHYPAADAKGGPRTDGALPPWGEFAQPQRCPFSRTFQQPDFQVPTDSWWGEGSGPSELLGGAPSAQGLLLTSHGEAFSLWRGGKEGGVADPQAGCFNFELRCRGFPAWRDRDKPLL